MKGTNNLFFVSQPSSIRLFSREWFDGTSDLLGHVDNCEVHSTVQGVQIKQWVHKFVHTFYSPFHNLVEQRSLLL
jgi:hypothetical protein